MADEANTGMSFDEALALAVGHNPEVNTVYETMPEVKETETAAPVTGTETVATATKEAAPAQQTQAEPKEDFSQQKAVYEAQIAELKRQASASDKPPIVASQDWEEDLKVDPVSALKGLLGDKVNFRQLATDLWYEELGEKAPNEYRAMKEARAAKLQASKTQRALETESKRRDEERAVKGNQEAFDRYVGALQSFSQAAPPESHPLLQRLQKVHPEQAVQGLLNVAGRIVTQNKGASEPTPQEVASAFEQELAEWKRLLTEGDVVAQTPVAKEPDANPAPTSLRNIHTQVQPAKTEVDELDSDVLRAKAFKELEKVAGRALSG
jgi:hypothetical protein